MALPGTSAPTVSADPLRQPQLLARRNSALNLGAWTVGSSAAARALSKPLVSWAAVGAVLLFAACGGRPAEAPHEARPLEQALARELIRQAVRDEGATPTAELPIALPRDKQLQADVGVAGKKLAIAFVTGQERQMLGASVPAYDVGSAALQLVRDAADHDLRVLVLHDLGYMTDEQSGEEREVSSVVVKNRLQRDVRDFLAEARKRGWP
jgi:hypothetical protein